MPYSLKVVDAVLFAVFNILGLNVTVSPILKGEAYTEYVDNLVEYDWFHERGGGCDSDSDHDAFDCEAALEFERQLRNKTRVGNQFHKLKMANVETDACHDPMAVRQARQFPSPN